MNDLIKVSYESERPTVMGRELHEVLGVRTAYKDWFPRMCEYGFTENSDYVAIAQKRATAQGNVTTYIDHQITLEMAKEICMIQRSEIGKKCRAYFLELERKWNSPEAVMARALQFAERQLSLVKAENIRLLDTVAVQTQQIAELTPKASYYDVVLACPDLLSTTEISKDYGWSAQKMNNWLHKMEVQFKRGDVWLLYQEYAEMGYTSTKTHVYTGKDGQPHTKVHTYWTQKGRLFIYELMKKNGHLPTIEKEGAI